MLLGGEMKQIAQPRREYQNGMYTLYHNCAIYAISGDDFFFKIIMFIAWKKTPQRKKMAFLATILSYASQKTNQPTDEIKPLLNIIQLTTLNSIAKSHLSNAFLEVGTTNSYFV